MRRLVIAGIVIGLAVTAAGCSKKEDKEKVNAPVAEVRQTVEAFGVARARELKNINLSFPAVVEKVHVREGQKVKNGDILLSLDIEEYKSQLKNKELELKALQRELNILVASKNGSGPDVGKLQNEARNAEELYNKAVKELADKEELFKSGSISQYELDEFKKSVNERKKSMENTRLSVNELRNNKSIEVDQKLSRASQLESDIALMKDRLGESYIKDNNIVADVNNGVVYDLGYKQGDNISKEKKVLSIMDLDTLIIEADVAEEFIKEVKLGAEVTIIPTADKSKNFKGKVVRIADKAFEKNGETNVLVEIGIEEKNDFILPDFNVDVKIKME